MAFVYDWLTQHQRNCALIYSDYKGVFNTADTLNKQLSNLQLVKNTLTFFFFEKKSSICTEDIELQVSHDIWALSLDFTCMRKPRTCNTQYCYCYLYSGYLRNCKRAVFRLLKESPSNTSAKVGLVWICKSTTWSLMARFTILLTIWMKYTKENRFRIELV